MKQKLLNMKKKYTVMKKRYLFLLFALLAIAIGNNYRFLDTINDEKKAYRVAGEDVTTWTHALLGNIADKWDAEELLTRAHPVLLGNIKASGRSLQESFAPLAALGKLRKDNCALANFGTSKNDTDHFAVATISCNPEYERGTANVIVELKRDHLKSPWRVTAFTFNLLSVIQEK